MEVTVNQPMEIHSDRMCRSRQGAQSAVFRCQGLQGPIQLIIQIVPMQFFPEFFHVGILVNQQEFHISNVSKIL